MTKTNSNQTRAEIGQLLENHQPQLKAFVSKYIDNKSDTDDVVQDVFYQFIKTVEDAITPIEQVSAWLYRVARNTLINKGKKKREEEWPVNHFAEGDEEFLVEFEEILWGDEHSSTPEWEYLRSMVWTELEEALSDLPLEQREVFELTELDGIPVKEISKALNVPVNTLLSRKHYAVKHLRSKLSQLYDDLMYE